MTNFHNPNPGFLQHISHYHPIGDGRDTYISFNNGGVWKRNYTDGMESSQYFRSPKRYLTKKPNIPAKNIHYPPDGSGRDYFIKFDEGGVLQSPGISPHYKNYITSLRSYNKSSYGNRQIMPDFFMDSQRAILGKDYYRVCETAKSQKRLVERLSHHPENKLPLLKTKERSLGAPQRKSLQNL